MQMTGDLTFGAGRLMTEGDRADGNFIRNRAAEIRWQLRIMIAGNPDPVTPHLQR